MSVHQFAIALPPGYRQRDALAFHGRDPEAFAERVDTEGAEGARIRKGIMLDGAPVLLGIAFGDGQARCSIDGAGDASLARARAALISMLGLRIDPAPFIERVRDDLLFAPLVRREGSLRVIQAATVFEALSWAIIGQQINLPFAIALRRTLIGQAGRAHPGGLWCYPEAADVARLDIEQLTGRKFSRAKAETLLRLARLVADGALELEPELEPGLMPELEPELEPGLVPELAPERAPGRARDPDRSGVEAISARLLAIKGIGPWTVNYALLRGYGYPDCSLHGDVAVRNAIRRLLGAAERPDMPQAEAFLQAYRPHRTMACAYLWASLGQPAE